MAPVSLFDSLLFQDDVGRLHGIVKKIQNPKNLCLWKVGYSLFLLHLLPPHFHPTPPAFGESLLEPSLECIHCPSNSPGRLTFKAGHRSRPPPKGLSNLSLSQPFLLLRNAGHLFTISGIPLTRSHTEHCDISGTVESPVCRLLLSCTAFPPSHMLSAKLCVSSYRTQGNKHWACDRE